MAQSNWQPCYTTAKYRSIIFRKRQNTMQCRLTMTPSLISFTQPRSEPHDLFVFCAWKVILPGSWCTRNQWTIDVHILTYPQSVSIQTIIMINLYYLNPKTILFFFVRYNMMWSMHRVVPKQLMSWPIDNRCIFHTCWRHVAWLRNMQSYWNFTKSKYNTVKLRIMDPDVSIFCPEICLLLTRPIIHHIE